MQETRRARGKDRSEAGREVHRFVIREEPGTGVSWERTHSMHLCRHAYTHRSDLLPRRHCRPPQMLSQHPTSGAHASAHTVSLELYSWSSGGQHLLQPPTPARAPVPHTAAALTQAFPLSDGVCGDMVHCLSCKHNDLSLIPNVIKVEVVVCAGIYSAGGWGRDKWILGACRITSPP